MNLCGWSDKGKEILNRYLSQKASESGQSISEA